MPPHLGALEWFAAHGLHGIREDRLHMSDFYEHARSESAQRIEADQHIPVPRRSQHNPNRGHQGDPPSEFPGLLREPAAAARTPSQVGSGLVRREARIVATCAHPNLLPITCCQREDSCGTRYPCHASPEATPSIPRSLGLSNGTNPNRVSLPSRVTWLVTTPGLP